MFLFDQKIEKLGTLLVLEMFGCTLRETFSVMLDVKYSIQFANTNYDGHDHLIFP